MNALLLWRPRRSNHQSCTEYKTGLFQHIKSLYPWNQFRYKRLVMVSSTWIIMKITFLRLEVPWYMHEMKFISSDCLQQIQHGQLCYAERVIEMARRLLAGIHLCRCPASNNLESYSDAFCLTDTVWLRRSLIFILFFASIKSKWLCYHNNTVNLSRTTYNYWNAPTAANVAYTRGIAAGQQTLQSTQ